MRKKDSFTRSLSYVFIAKVIIVIFSLITTPFLTRVYSPASYGFFAFFNTIATNFAILCSLGFPNALVIVKSSRDFYNLLVASMLLTLVFLIIGSLLFVVIMEMIVPFDLGDDRGTYIALTIVGSFTFSCMLVLAKWNIWQKQFKKGASINVLTVGTSRLVGLGIGFFGGGYAFGIIIGEIVGKIVGLFANIKVNVIREWKELRANVSWKLMWDVLTRYKDYPKYVLTGTYLSTFTASLPLFVFSFYFDAAMVGGYSLALGLIALPGILLTQPVGSVLTKKLSDIGTSDATLRPLVRRVVYGLFFAGLIPYTFSFIWGPDIFQLIFGSDWRTAGQFAAIMSLYGLFEVVELPMHGIFQVLRKEILLFRFTLLQLILTVISLIPGIYEKDPYVLIWGVTIARLIFSFLLISNSLRLVSLNPVKFILIFVIVTGTVIYIFWLSKIVLML